MNRREWRTFDNKSSWGFGPWVDEPDKVQWTDAKTRLPCLIVRNGSGSLCGYVGVSPGHPWHGRGHHEIDGVEVHGGLTFSEGCADSGDPSRGVCHIPEPGEPDHVWWFGFDCAHAWDFSPVVEARFGPSPGARYRTLAWVERQVARLARQVAKARS